MALTLKRYQQNSLDCLQSYLQLCQRQSPALAFAAVWAAQNDATTGAANPVPAYNERFGPAVPAVCLRVPTGGGKTLMAAHAVALAGRAVQHTEAPVALWLTPSDTIRTQTLEAFNDARHPYRQALTAHFGDRVRVCDLGSLQTIGPHDVGHAAIVVVTTIQSLSVRRTSDRNVYSFFEELAQHFSNLPGPAPEGLEKVTAEDLKKQPYLTVQDIGRAKYSVANWLHLQRPVVIVDEAHNNQTETFFNTIGRVNPCCMIEFTATPVRGINVLHHVSAQELKAEQMVKLPIVLNEHPQGWRECLHDARLTRDKLELLAQAEADYLRPIALIQAEPINGAATVDVVLKHLIEDELIPADQIKVATGTQKQLDGVDLFDRACQVRYVITVEALKEGWDCSFAYVLASLQEVRSAKDVEQLLGRVLRMPYARDRQQPELNRAYAHIVANSFAEAAHNITDRLVQNMGFNRFEAASIFVDPRMALPLTGGQGAAPALPDCYIALPAMPEPAVVAQWPDAVRQAVELRPTSGGAALLMRGDLPENVLNDVEASVLASLPAKARGDVQQQLDVQRQLRAASLAPATLGHSFAPIPQLCLALDGHLEVVDRTALAGMGRLDLLALPVRLDSFSIAQNVNAWEIDLRPEGMQYGYVNSTQMTLDTGVTNLTEEDLVRWLDREVRQPDIGQLHMQKWLLRLVAHLQHDGSYSLAQLVRARFALVPAVLSEIDRLRAHAVNQGFQAHLPGMTVADPHEAPHCSFRFEPGIYPARNVYRGGSYRFTKHFYGSHLIHDLQERTPGGELSEEFLCARAIDTCPEVKHWVRNIERQEKTSFWLPTSTDYFYPDFVAELHDGRVLAVEYKGEDRWSNDDSKEKRLVGKIWADLMNKRSIFIMTNININPIEPLLKFK